MRSNESVDKAVEPLVSVLTPTFESLRFLPDAILSVSSQGRAIEHVIVDGASTDGTRAFLEREQRANVKWISEPDSGQSDALNKAVHLASGQIVGWLNADEWYLPGTIDAVVAVFERDPSIDVVFGDYYEVDEKGIFRRLVTSHPFRRSVLRNYGCFVPSCATFIRRSVLPEVPWNTEHRWIMDLDLWLRLDEAGAKFRHVRRGLSAFRIHESQVTSGNIVAALPEWTSLFHRYGIASDGPRRSHYRSARLLHRLLKVADGGYLREMAAARRLKGRVVPGRNEPN
jgi:glycosyltransferase involved in cell wall biosynthesis